MIKLKKKAYSFSVLLALSSQVFAYNVINFDDFGMALKDANTTNIELQNNISGDYYIGNITPNNVVINGNGYSIESTDNNLLTIGTNKYLKVSNVSAFTNFQAGEGAVFFNKGNLTLENSTFKENGVFSTQNVKGGAVLNTGGLIDIIDNVSFIENSAYSDGGKSYGGALYNSGTIGTIQNSHFKENIVASFDDSSQGGAIYNNKNATIEIINTSTFQKNKAMYGGAIANNANNVIEEIQNTQFNENLASASTDAKGGAIYNENSTIGKITDTSFNGNLAESTQKRAYGGAIYNSGTINTINNVTFKNNSANSHNDAAYGGAIYSGTNGTIAMINNTTFKDNNAKFGGAINANGSIIGIIKNSTFENNNANATTNAKGGAINAEKSYVALIDNTRFVNNIATSTGENAAAMGGAIANTDGTINIASITGDVVFIGNTADGVPNALHNRAERYEKYIDGNLVESNDVTSTINLNAGDYQIIVNDGIGGHSVLNKEYIDENDNSTTETTKSYVNNIININKGDIQLPRLDENNENITDFYVAPTHGNVIIANKIDGNEVNLYNGSLILTSHTYSPEESQNLAGQTGIGHFTSNSSFNIYGGTLSMMDNSINRHPLGNVGLYNNASMQVDADLANQTMDTISADSFSKNNDYQIVIDKVNLLSATTANKLELTFVENMDKTANAELSNSIKYTGGEIAYSPVYKYNVAFNGSKGKFNFSLQDVNPNILSSTVAAQSGAIATQNTTFGEAFYAMDTFMARDVNERIMMRDRNKYASNYAQGMLWDDAIARRDSREAWIRPYVTFESVPLKNGPKVDNIAYGTYFGTNTPIKKLSRGWDGAAGLYIGYNGSRQSYEHTNVIQNGGTIGLVGELYRNNFFTGLSINTGASHGIADTMWGKDKFDMFTAGVASKSGYNFEFKEGKLILQPTMLLGYSFINTFDFTNAAGVRITSDPLHSIHVEPGLRFIANHGNGFKTYAGVSMIWNLLDKTKSQADGLDLPETSIKPYVKYGVGVQKLWSDRASSFFQVYVTNGGRNGVGLQGGVSYLY